MAATKVYLLVLLTGLLMAEILVDMLVDLLVAKKVVEMDYLKVVVKVQLMVAN